MRITNICTRSVNTDSSASGKPGRNESPASSASNAGHGGLICGH